MQEDFKSRDFFFFILNFYLAYITFLPKSEGDVWFHLSEILISCVIMQLDRGLNFSNN